MCQDPLGFPSKSCCKSLLDFVWISQVLDYIQVLGRVTPDGLNLLGFDSPALLLVKKHIHLI